MTCMGNTLPLPYLGQLIQQGAVVPIGDEAILDGTLANEHKAVVLDLHVISIRKYHGPAGVPGGGGLMLLTGDCPVQIKGAVSWMLAKMPDQAIIRVRRPRSMASFFFGWALTPPWPVLSPALAVAKAS